MHLAGPLDGLDEAARTGHGPIGGVIVSRRDRSLCVEDLCDILVEVHAVVVKRGVLLQGQTPGGAYHFLSSLLSVLRYPGLLVMLYFKH